MTESFGSIQAEMKIVGRLSSLIQSYVRSCCRSGYDGTDIDTLNEYRCLAIKMLSLYEDEYAFVNKHIRILEEYEPEKVLLIIRESRVKILTCGATDGSIGLPKTACLHCREIGTFIERMRKELPK